jgi:hypothetical protein
LSQWDRNWQGEFMRIGTLLLLACSLVCPCVSFGQVVNPSFGPATSPSVIRPAPTVAFRNYVTVPDGPCGYPMAVQADCYQICRPCGPLHPICFLHRVGRMFDALLPCNMCCRGGGCGLFNHAGHQPWGHCSVCCGGAGGRGAGAACGNCGGLFGLGLLGGRGGCGGGCGGRSGCGGCVNPAGSVFDSCSTPSCTTGGHCYGCSSALPGFENPFVDDPEPPKAEPQPALPAKEVRRTLPQRQHTAAVVPARQPVPRAAAAAQSPYKIVTPQSSATAASATQPQAAPSPAGMRKTATQSVLRRASAEEEIREPARLPDYRQVAAPIVRSQSPEYQISDEVPVNPLRR